MKMSHFKNTRTLQIVNDREILLTLSIVVSFFAKVSSCTWQASHFKMVNAIAKLYKGIIIASVLIKSLQLFFPYSFSYFVTNNFFK